MKNAIFGLKKRHDFWTEIIIFHVSGHSEIAKLEESTTTSITKDHQNHNQNPLDEDLDEEIEDDDEDYEEMEDQELMTDHSEF